MQSGSAGQRRGAAWQRSAAGCSVAVATGRRDGRGSDGEAGRLASAMSAAAETWRAGGRGTEGSARLKASIHQLLGVAPAADQLAGLAAAVGPEVDLAAVLA